MWPARPCLCQNQRNCVAQLNRSGPNQAFSPLRYLSSCSVCLYSVGLQSQLNFIRPDILVTPSLVTASKVTMSSSSNATTLPGSSTGFYIPSNNLWALISTACIILGLLVPTSLLQSQYEKAKIWHSQPCVGIKNQLFPWTRAMMRSIWQTEAMISEGYAKVLRSLDALTSQSACVVTMCDSFPKLVEHSCYQA